jgi:hypothetical protein
METKTNLKDIGQLLNDPANELWVLSNGECFI